MDQHVARPEEEAPAPVDWLAALRRSDADLAAGRVVRGDQVRAKLRADIESFAADAGPARRP